MDKLFALTAPLFYIHRLNLGARPDNEVSDPTTIKFSFSFAIMTLLR